MGLLEGSKKILLILTLSFLFVFSFISDTRAQVPKGPCAGGLGHCYEGTLMPNYCRLVFNNKECPNNGTCYYDDTSCQTQGCLGAGGECIPTNPTAWQMNCIDSMNGTKSDLSCPAHPGGLDWACCMPANAQAQEVSDSATIQDVQQQAQETSAGTAEAAPAADSGGSSVGTPGIQNVGCEETGDCSIEQIVQKAVYFAQFIMGLSGALFLIVFIYGGALYILSFGRSEWVNKGQKAMVQAAIGIVFVMGAWTIVWYVAQSLGYTG